MSMTGDTIAAVATAPGRGGVAVVRVSGPDAYAVATRVTGRPVDASWAGRFFHARFGAFDDGLVLVFREPASYTGENVVELQGHGGSVAPRRLLEACLAAGARLARRGEFTERAFLNGRLDLGMAEAVIDLVDARTERAADDAAARLAGVASRAFEDLYARVIDVSSRVEHALDFDEGELPTDFSAQVARDVQELRMRVDRKLSTAREGRILREGALVVLAGAPNAGKSSLLNALVGERRAIVSLTAGTTRDAIEEWLEIGGWPVRLVDTAGLRATADAVEAEGVARAEELLARADVVLWLTAADGEGEAVERTKAEGTVIPIVSKCDLDPVGKAAGLRISVKTGEGLEELRGEIARCLTARAAKSAEEVGADITTRQTACLREARQALVRAQNVLGESDWVVAANELRVAAESIGRILGKVYSDDLLEALFSRFCIGK